MPKTVTVRLFRLGRQSSQGVSLRQALDAIAGGGPPGSRERQLTVGIRCRLERYDTRPGWLSGEMTRVRHEDFPSEVHPHGTRELNVDVPIGDGVAFMFREADHTLAIQFDNRILSVGRFLDYVQNVHGTALFHYKPIADEAALERFRAQPLKKVSIKIASPIDVAAQEDAMQAAASSFRELGERYDAPVVTLSLGVGRKKGVLGHAAKGMMEGFLRSLPNGENDVRSARATPKNDQGPSEEINLLDSLFSHREDVDNPRQVEENYQVRSRLLERVLRANP